jgi:hypothetical protein
LHRLTHWILAAALFAVAVTAAVTEPGWHCLLGALHVPAVLAAMLLARATALVLMKRPLGLQFAGRTVLAGKAALWLPAFVLLAWTALRESGAIRVRASAQSSNRSLSSLAEAWTERTDQPLLTAPEIRIQAPANVFGAAIDRQFADHWLSGDWRLCAEITVDGGVPMRPWPLYKTAMVRWEVQAVLQLQPLHGDAPVRCSKVRVEVDGEFRMLGFASQRDFHEWLGHEVGRAVHGAISDHVDKGRK